MKREYTKPLLVYEDFRLMDAIMACANGTGMHSNQGSPEGCSLTDPAIGVAMFLNADVNGCVLPVSSNETLYSSYFGS